MASGIKGRVLRIADEVGFITLKDSCRDTKLLCLQRFVRMYAFGISFLVLVDFLSSKSFTESQIGLFMTLTLLGDVLVSLVLTSITDQVGRRRILLAGSGLMIASGVVFAAVDNYIVLLIASIFGVISPTGNEIGPFRAVEQSVLAHLTDKSKHSDIFAWNILIGTAGAALGAVSSGLTVHVLENVLGSTKIFAYRIIFYEYAVAGGIKLFSTMLLSKRVEVEPVKVPEPESELELEQGLLSGEDDSDNDDESNSANRPEVRPNARVPQKQRTSLSGRLRSLLPSISPASRAILFRLVFLFFMDSFASGMATSSWITYFFTTVHSLRPATLGVLFMITNICATLSNLFAVPLAKRLGPLKTMTFTHLPSAVFLAVMAIPPASGAGTWIAMTFLTLRACTQSMDQAPRQAFLAAAVLPDERTAIMGFVNVVKTLAQSGGIGLAGVLADHKWWVVLFGGAGLLKISYDLLLLWMFLRVKDRVPAMN
ncbi:hypothetical protein PFICI_02810 [Pestalotiopsis fici W106-1]|uniref:Major facilitator superfamily (MFS) profile domain-containing protein n=1 Tax=Pestalotiopsis fici (strain W106-1 / CGMCC3.15140) TaxID=1229662 RepID=W3XFI2_PESFW|nr:uncharacterized protein PFICI_02810 [Pestalotiopsis fici W106-1]ETS84785.1 hypothetical protein PFICI_02810 [Pestalotiopsis fici W106-1]